MNKRFIFWFLMLVWLLFGFWLHWDTLVSPPAGGHLLIFLIIAVLGWQTFGQPVD